MNVSTNHRRLTADEIPAVAAAMADSWKDPSIPRKQWEVVRGELDLYRRGVSMRHFDVLLRTLREIPLKRPSLLDVGASSGYYSEVLKIGGFQCRYHALDYSEEYLRLASELFPGILFYLDDAEHTRIADGCFDIVLHSACLMHLTDYAEAISEAARMSSGYVVFHRTPVVFDGETVAYQKDAYDVPCLEWHFNEYELFTLFSDNGLEVVREETIFRDTDMQYSHKTYLTKKV